MQSPARVGLLLVVFIALLWGGYAALGKNIFAPKNDIYYAEFSDANGVVEGAKVLMAGVRVGSTGPVELKSPKLARVTLKLYKTAHVPEGTIAVIPTQLIGLGDMVVSLVPPDKLTGVNISVGQTLQGQKANPLDGFLPDAKQTIKELNLTLAAARKLLQDQKLQHDVTALLETTNATMTKFGAIAASADRLMASNQANISDALREGSLAITDVRRVIASVAKLVNDGKIKGDAQALINQMKSIAKKADSLVSSMNNLVGDPQFQANIKQSTANVAQMTETGKSIAASTDAMAKDGKVISANAIELTNKAKEIADKASIIEDQLSGVLGKVSKVIDKSPSPKGIGKIESEMSLFREASPAHLRTDLGVAIPLSGGKFHLGLWDAFESNKVTGQMEVAVNPKLDYRYGIYASKPGLGVDYRIAPNVFLRNDLWDLNHPRFDARLRYDFDKEVSGWLGLDRIFDRNAPTIGISIRH